MQACEGLVCGKFSILPLVVFRCQKDPVGGLVGLEMGSEKGFQWAGFGGCGGGLVGVEGVWWAWRSHLLHPWRIRPTPVSLRPPNLIKLTNGSVQFHGQAWQCKQI